MNTSKQPKTQKNISEALDDILEFEDDSEKLEFEEMVINSDVVNLITELMERNDIKTRKELAAKLGVTPAFVTKFFRSDKYFNVPLLAKLQRIFDTKFKVVAINKKEKIPVSNFVSTLKEMVKGIEYEKGNSIDVYANKIICPARVQENNQVVKKLTIV